jgi:two-component system response regulator LytT
MMTGVPGFSVLIVEDEPIVARRVERLTRDSLGERLARLQAVDTVEAGIAGLEAGGVDLLLLDLNLHGEDGFEILRVVASFAAQTIIVSAYADKAAQAFDHGVVDFVTKPFDAERLDLALQRFAGRTEPVAQKARFLSFRTGRRASMVELEDVVLIRGADKYSEVVLRDGSVRLHDKSLRQMAELLPAEFMRVHKSNIVRLDQIESLHSQPGNRHELVFKTGERAPVSRSMIATVRALFQ